MTQNDPLMQKLTDIQARYTDTLMNKANVIGVGLGYKQIKGTTTTKLSLVVMVTQKVPKSQLAPQDVIPDQIEGVAVDVQEMGVFTAQPGVP